MVGEITSMSINISRHIDKLLWLEMGITPNYSLTSNYSLHSTLLILKLLGVSDPIQLLNISHHSLETNIATSY